MDEGHVHGGVSGLVMGMRALVRGVRGLVRGNIKGGVSGVSGMARAE